MDSVTTTIDPLGRALAAGTVVAGKYRILGEIGRGGMGVVYEAEDLSLRRPVALKFLPAELTDSPEARERFVHEARAASLLDNPHICTIHEIGEGGDGRMFIAMALCRGESLRTIIRRGGLTPAAALSLAAQVAEGLAAAHAAGIVHRDIKPANIMRLKDGTLRVTDFGIARITASSKTQTGTVMGTPSYMSPEQVAGKKVDGRADLFSLGVMLYEMMTGLKPFEGDSIATLLFRISSEPHPDPVLKASDRVTPAVKAVIDKALQKNPDNRYQRGKDLSADLKECLKNPNAVPTNALAAAVSAPPAAPVAPPAAPSSSDTVRLSSPPPAAPAPSPSDTVKMPPPAPSDTIRMPPQ